MSPDAPAIDVEALRERIGDRVVIASISGGKDSTAMALHLQELGIPYRAVNMDTGWEHADTDHYVREVLPKYIGPIETIVGPMTVKPEAQALVDEIEGMLGRESAMVRLVLNKGSFPSRMGRFCTEQLKTKVMKQYLDGLDNEPLNAVGVRASESVARSKLPEWEWWRLADCEQWRPLLRWSDQDVVDIHKRHNVPPNPLYLRGAHRVGCWPCVYARKSEIRNIAETDPERIDMLEALEAAVTERAVERLALKGETLESKGFTNGFAWFQSMDGGGSCWPIRKVVQWAKTRRGGKQFEMFAPPAREWGCMRWGVCDTGAQAGDEA